MPGSEDTRRPLPFSRGELVGVWMLFLGLTVSLVWLVHPWYDPAPDAAMYLATARSLIRGEGYSMLGQPFVIRPPGFALLIAPVLRLRGLDFFALNLLVSSFGLVACGCLYAFARRRIGALAAGLLVLVLWFNPGIRELSCQAMSDVPGLALILACLLLERWADRKPAWWRDVLLGLAIGLSSYVRTVLVLLVLAIAVARLLRRAPSKEELEPLGRRLARTALLALAVFAAQLPWQLRNSRIDQGASDQTFLVSYSTGMWHEDGGDPNSRRLGLDEVLARIPEQGGLALSVIGSRMGRHEPGEIPIAVFLVVSLVLVAVKRRESLEIFALGNLVLLSLYFGFMPRLVLPVFVAALLAGVEVLGMIAGRVRAARRLLPLGGLLLLLGLDADPRPGWDEIQRRDELLRTITEEFETLVPPEAVLASNRAWHYALLMDRPVYGLEVDIQRGGDVSAAEETIDKYGIQFVVLSPNRPKDAEVLPYFAAKYEERRAPHARAFRVR